MTRLLRAGGAVAGAFAVAGFVLLRRRACRAAALPGVADGVDPADHAHAGKPGTRAGDVRQRWGAVDRCGALLSRSGRRWPSRRAAAVTASRRSCRRPPRAPSGRHGAEHQRDQVCHLHGAGIRAGHGQGRCRTPEPRPARCGVCQGQRKRTGGRFGVHPARRADRPDRDERLPRPGRFRPRRATAGPWRTSSTAGTDVTATGPNGVAVRTARDRRRRRMAKYPTLFVKAAQGQQFSAPRRRSRNDSTSPADP